jgi:hypothetical protein
VQRIKERRENTEDRYILYGTLPTTADSNHRRERIERDQTPVSKEQGWKTEGMQVEQGKTCFCVTFLHAPEEHMKSRQ